MRDFDKRAKIVLVDDNANHLKGVKELITLESNYDVVGMTTQGNMALSVVRKYRPDVLILDVNMPDKDGLQIIQEITKANINVKILVLSSYDDADLIYRTMKLGARGYVLKTMSSIKLITAIEDVLAGKVYLPTILSTRFFEYFQKTTSDGGNITREDNLLNTLTNRETEVLSLLTGGINYKTIAKNLIISETTVKTHINNIFQKLQVNDRTNAVLYALSHGFKPNKSSDKDMAVA